MTDNHDDSDNDRFAAPFNQHRNDETTDHNPSVFGQVGTGKTHQIGTELARRLTDDAEASEWIDPKGESMSKGEGEENGG